MELDDQSSQLIMPVPQRALVILSVLLLVFVSCDRSEEEWKIVKMELLTGLTAPPSATHVQDIYHGFIKKDNYKIGIYARADGQLWFDGQDCEAHGLLTGLFNHIEQKIDPLAEHINVEQELCYQIMAKKRTTKAVFIQQNKLYYYWQYHWSQFDDVSTPNNGETSEVDSPKK